MYRGAKAYYKAHGNLDIPCPYKTPEGIPLGRWIRTRRNVHNGNSAWLLDERRIQLFNEIGMVGTMRSLPRGRMDLHICKPVKLRMEMLML